jgi:uncharacterized protein (TIGR04255 family)
MHQVRRPYPHAPIKEALVDFRVKSREDISLHDLRPFGQEVKGSYPSETTREQFQAQFNIGGEASSDQKTIGYLYHSADRRQAVQARLDGFTFSRFSPYVDWPQLIEEAKRLWHIYVAAVRPQSIDRVAVRYINQLNIPIPASGELDLKQYLRTYAEIGPDAPQLVEQYLLRMVLPQGDLGAILVLTQAILPQPPPRQNASVLLDLDLFREGVDLPVDSDEAWTILATFRERKNLYFEASITDAMRELFS